MNEAHINKLFQNLPVGQQAIFEHRLKQWKDDDVPTANQFSSTYSNKKTPTLMTILQDTHTGLQILQYYETKQCFHEEQRILLINTIARYLEVKGYECTIANCSDIEKQICSLFPTEQLVKI